MRSDVRRYNAAVRRANNLAGKGSSQLIHIETVSEIERYTMAKDADRLVARTEMDELCRCPTTCINFISQHACGHRFET